MSKTSKNIKSLFQCIHACLKLYIFFISSGLPPAYRDTTTPPTATTTTLTADEVSLTPRCSRHAAVARHSHLESQSSSKLNQTGQCLVVTWKKILLLKHGLTNYTFFIDCWFMIVTENVPDREQMYHSKEELAMVNMNHYPSSGELRFWNNIHCPAMLFLPSFPL